jgi:hypothetical protein
VARPSFVACAGQFAFVFVLLLRSARIGTQPGFICSQGSASSSDKSLTLRFIADQASGSEPTEQPSLHLIVPTHTHSLVRFPRVSGCPMGRAHPILIARSGSSFGRKIL